MHACVSDRLDMVKYLIEEQNVDKEEQAINGTTPLHTAVQCGTLPLVQYLIEKHQCNVQVRDNFGTTPLIQAVTSDKIDIMK